MSNHTTSYSGINYCPECGCNIRALGIAQLLAATRNQPPQKPKFEASSESDENGSSFGTVRRPKHRGRHVITDEESVDIMKRRDGGQSFAFIADALGLKRATVYQHYRRVKDTSKRAKS